MCALVRECVRVCECRCESRCASVRVKDREYMCLRSWVVVNICVYERQCVRVFVYSKCVHVYVCVCVCVVSVCVRVRL